MKRMVTTFWLLYCCISSALAGDFPDTVKAVKPGIVGIGFYAPLATVSHQLKGTGFVVANGQYVVTNDHVIEKEPQGDIKYNKVIFLPKGRKYGMVPVEAVYTDKAHDIAILKIKPTLPALTLAKEERIAEDGEDVAITGFPIGAILGLYPATHRGIIASYTPNIISAANSQQLSERSLKSLENPFMVYQLDITAYPGNSGSPVYDTKTGHVLAVINKVFVKETKESAITAPSGITYAIPVQHIYALAREKGLF